MDINCTFNKIKIRVHLNAKWIDVIGYYRPPSNINIDEFFLDLEQELDSPEPIIIGGDINIDINKQNQITGKYHTLLSSYGAKILNNQVTRPASNTIIDHFIVRDVPLHFIIYTCETSMSDHNIIIASTKSNLKTKSIVHTKKFINFAGIKNNFLFNSPQDTDPNLNFNLLVTEIQNSLAANTDTRSFKLKKSCDIAPWSSLHTLELLKRKENIIKKIRQLKKNNLPTSKLSRKLTFVADKIHRNSVSACKSYYTNKLGSSNIKDVWKVLNELSGKPTKRSDIQLTDDNGNIISDSSIIAEILNNKFISNTLSGLTPLHYAYPLPMTNDSMTLRPTDINEIITIIKSLCANKSVGHDNIHVRTIQSIADEISPILVNIINCVFDEGKYPDKLKMAHVAPIFKSGDKHSEKNYRPISILPSLNKIFEIVLLERLKEFADKNSLQDPHQFGFSTNSSTESALIELVNTIHKHLDKKRLVIAVFLDVSKAFDTIPHEILYLKLENYGIRGKALDLIKNYLTNRTQAVKVNNVLSSYQPLTRGVAQGSNTAPFFFNLCLLDFTHLPITCNATRFADDIVFYTDCHPNKLDETLEILKIDTGIIIDYHHNNGLNINHKKSSFIIFHPSNCNFTLPPSINLLDNTSIERTTSQKYLGCLLDQHCLMLEHVTFIISKLKPVVNLLSKLKWIIPSVELLKIYHAHFHSHLYYAASIYGLCVGYKLKEIQILQNRALKHVFKLPLLQDSVSLYENIAKGILPLQGVIFLSTVSFIHKLLLKKIKSNIKISTNNNNTRSNGSLTASSFKSNYMKTDITYFGVQLYNKLPADIRNEENIDKFKSAVKILLLKNINKLLSFSQFSLLDIQF